MQIKKEPKLQKNRKYKNFSLDIFKEDLTGNLISYYNSYDFDRIVIYSQLNKRTPKKRKMIRGNNKPHVRKDLHSAIIKWLKIKSKANKTKSPGDIINYKKRKKKTRVNLI